MSVRLEPPPQARIRDSAGRLRSPVRGFTCTVGECRQWSPAQAWLATDDAPVEPGHVGGTCPICLIYHDLRQPLEEVRWLIVENPEEERHGRPDPR